MLLLVKNESGNPVRWIAGTNKKGLHRANWDLRYPAPNPINLSKPAFTPPWAGEPQGPLATPGQYTVELFIEHNGKLQPQGSPQTFTVKPVPTLSPNSNLNSITGFQVQTSELMREISSAGQKLSEAGERLRFIKAALKQTPKATAQHFAKWQELNEGLSQLRMSLWGDPIRQRKNESTVPSISGRVGQVIYGHWDTRQAPTKTFIDNLKIADTEFNKFKGTMITYFEELEKYEASLKAIGAPYTRARKF